MKLFFVALSVIASTFAQFIQILEPTPNTIYGPNDQIPVSVLRPNSNESFTTIGIAITFASCATSPCPDMSQDLGDVLYAGAYDPTTPLPPTQGHGFYENFTVTVPENADRGAAALSVVLAGLDGAGPAPFTQVVNVTIFLEPTIPS